MALSTADGIFGMRDKNAQMRLLRLAEEAMFLGMYLGRNVFENSHLGADDESDETCSRAMLNHASSTGVLYALLRVRVI